MSATLYALVVLQGANGLTFSPGYTTAAECMQQYKGPNVGPSKGRPPSEKLIWGIPHQSQSAKVVLGAVDT